LHLHLTAIMSDRCAVLRNGRSSMMKVSFPAGASSYYTSTAGRPASAYYTNEATLCEPPGVWWGAGAASLGLAGEVDADQAAAVFDQLLDPRDEHSRDRASWAEASTLGRAPGRYKSADHIEAEMLAAEPDATPERREMIRIEAGLKARTARTFIDATFSPVKSVSLLHIAAVREAELARSAGDDRAAEAWQWVRTQVEDAVRTANEASLEYLADHGGYARAGHHGGAGGRWTDAHDLTVGTFFQYSTRTGDPGLHCHNLILNRVHDAEGEWRALDTACLIAAQHGAGAVADRTLEAELGRRLNVRFELRPNGVSREIAGTTEDMIEAVSTRSARIAATARPIVDAYEARVGRPITALERRMILDSVAERTRDRKDADHLETREQRAERIEQRIAATVHGGLSRIGADLLSSARGGTPQAEAFSPDSVIKEALARAAEGQATWTRHQLTRHIVALLPNLGSITPPEVRELAESLTNRALAMETFGEHRGAIVGATSEHGAVSVSGSVPAHVPADERLSNGRSSWQRPDAEQYATAGTLVAEKALRNAAVTIAGRSAASAAIRAWLDERVAAGLALGADQRAAIEGILTGGQQLSILVGPAGTGKSRTAAVLAEAWHDPAVWKDDQPGRMVGLAVSQNAANVLAELGMHSMNVHRWLLTQRRLAAGTATDDDLAHQLSERDLVLVDEASMVDTVAADEIRRHVEAAGARWVQAGDHRQLGAVGAGGMLADLAGRARTFELAEVHRMTETWEREASLRLRDGDVTVLADYERHGRLRTAPTPAHAEAAATRGWLADTIEGSDAVLIVGTNEVAARISAQCRDELVALGRVEAGGVHLTRQGTLAGVGDIVVTRVNDRAIEVWNRDRWRVAAVSDDGGLVVEPLTGGRQVTLPPDYVGTAVELGYATTEYGVQGLTVDRAHVVQPSAGSVEALYVDLTRARERTIVHVAATPEPLFADGQVHNVAPRSAASVLAEAIEREGADSAAAVVADRDAEIHSSAMTIVERWSEQVGRANAARLSEGLALLAATGEIGDEIPAAVAADDSRTQLAWLLRRVELAGHDPDVALRDAAARGSFDGARSVAQVLHGRIKAAYDDQLTPTPASASERVPSVGGERERSLTDLASLVDNRRRSLGADVADEPPRWALDAFGPVPTDPIERLEWEDRAGRVALHREVADHTDDRAPIGRCPSPGLVEHVAIWHDAWGALGRPELCRAEAEMSDGRLLVRVRAGELAERQAPAYVGDELREASVKSVELRQDAVLASARADVDAGRSDELRAQSFIAAGGAATAENNRVRLTEVDDARRVWLTENATTLKAADAARAELRERGIETGHEADRVTADEWLAAERQSRREDDPHRPVTEVDIDTADSSDRDNIATSHAAAVVVPDLLPTAAAAGVLPADPIDHELARARAARRAGRPPKRRGRGASLRGRGAGGPRSGMAPARRRAGGRVGGCRC
jgi:conjugative relaxase-like TrwC/TraI family protein